ncbi:hypothetical protein [Streptomyces albireticuli]|nr:hypothetical protein [Streptomyces albireticuli]MCD9145494.1 hypothetical protein [Streptomyces albireticuli]MCD9164941.1 hypothetical protein [Streptomyces albireticuli]MCD9195468.1 hypothetical protein [Streptomyces albireticuli]
MAAAVALPAPRPAVVTALEPEPADVDDGKERVLEELVRDHPRHRCREG